MTQIGDQQNVSARRVAATMVMLFGGALLIGLLVAPYLFNILTYLARRFPALESMRSLEFEKLCNRCVLVSILLALIPAVRMTGLAGWDRLGIKKDGGWFRLLFIGWIVGTVSMILLQLSGLASGAFYYQTGRLGWAVMGKAVSYIFGAILVGVIEEILFRGAVFGMLRRAIRIWPAAMMVSFIFAFVHFAGPEPPIGVVYGHWNSGLRMIPHMISPMDMRWEYGFMFVTLFFMSMTLCFLYAAFDNLYIGIGLHAGWVWLMRICDYLLERNDTVLTMLYGPSMSVAKSGLAMIEVLVFFAAALLLYDRKVCKARRSADAG